MPLKAGSIGEYNADALEQLQAANNSLARLHATV